MELKVFNNQGMKVATLFNGNKSTGTHNVTFNNIRRKLSNGEYFYEIKVGDTIKRMKMVLLK